MHFRSILLLLISTPLWAQTPAMEPAPEVPQTLEQADAQRERASRMRDEADKQLATEQAACYKKFLVNDCLADAKKRHTQTMIDARKIDNPAWDFQREAKRAEVEAKEAKRAAELPQREVDQQQQAESYRADEAARAAARDQKIADKALKAEEGRQKAAAEQAKRKAKLEKRAQKDAERAAKKAKEAAKSAPKTTE